MLYDVQSLLLWLAAMIGILSGFALGGWLGVLVALVTFVPWLLHLVWGGAYNRWVIRRARKRQEATNEFMMELVEELALARATKARQVVQLYGDHAKACVKPLDIGQVARGVRDVVRPCNCGFEQYQKELP